MNKSEFYDNKKAWAKARAIKLGMGSADSGIIDPLALQTGSNTQSNKNNAKQLDSRKTLQLSSSSGSSDTGKAADQNHLDLSQHSSPDDKDFSSF